MSKKCDVFVPCTFCGAMHEDDGTGLCDHCHAFDELVDETEWEGPVQTSREENGKDVFPF